MERLPVGFLKITGKALSSYLQCLLISTVAKQYINDKINNGIKVTNYCKAISKTPKVNEYALPLTHPIGP